MHSRKFFLSYVLLVSIVIGFGNVAHADESGIKLIPTTIEKAANPGDVISEQFQVTNESVEEKEFFFTVQNIKGVDDGGVPVFEKDNLEPTGYEISEWVSLSADSMQVSAGETKTFQVTITVPDSATPGSHFGGVFVSVEAPKLRQMGAGVGYGVVSILSIRITGDILDNARIRSFSSDKLFYSTKDVHFTAKIENQGNILIRPRGPLTIKNSLTGSERTLTINDTLAGVFPGTIRDLIFDWSEEGIGFGMYEAILALSYDGKDGLRTIDSTLLFWVFPVKIMVPILIGFITILLAGYLFTKYYIRKTLMRAAGGRRIQPQRYRKQVGVSRFTFVLIVLLSVLALFFIFLLIFFV